MKCAYFALLIAAALPATTFAGGVSHTGEESAAATTQVTEGVYDAEGTLNKIDAVGGVANISHGPIAALGWPAMTMDLKLEKLSLAKGLKAGIRVKFKLKKVSQTEYVVSAIGADI
jgi:Cu/Ag efflux protein CusF